MNGQPTTKATLESVAKLAGVAPSTVSRVLNTPDKVPQKTLDRVNQAISQTGYVPNLIAGSLASNRSRLIAAITPSMANLVYAETMQSFSRVLKDNGYEVLLGESGYDLKAEEKIVTTVLSRRPDAIFLTGIHHTLECRRRLHSAGIPIVESWDITPTPLDLVVGFSHAEVGKSVATYFCDKGYTSFSLASAGDQRAHVRAEAYLKELSARGQTDITPVIREPSPSVALGRSIMSDLLDQKKTPFAVFCSSDVVALGALFEVLARGLSIPDDVAIMGFGNQNFAMYTHPALSTVRVDCINMGEKSAQMLLARLQNEQTEGHSFDVGFEILARETS
ncbi:LacI family transcriptional regulator, gluconate utilization system Gnt-I transcriptional repressor [Cohaesibacter sp. ES.047]|uniref:LacI family DNA-binding transcriptional regulator n=1 Tax=Cohaesibacter sp. ES.047 TaxID=1798205 RepID=UPI000BB8FCD5|nr:LacI family DNA-binding transcriptional regulator [Cohaesibacter sp. ES.047]SNY90308.1 LacI family transcriptional regulator, gluconate utilization system Gnt-I transcriptional repressor [Cohaesibacter sp. ES.047]